MKKIIYLLFAIAFAACSPKVVTIPKADTGSDELRTYQEDLSLPEIPQEPIFQPRDATELVAAVYPFVVEVATTAELYAAVAAAATQPIGVIKATGTYYKIKKLELPKNLATPSNQLIIDGQNSLWDVDSMGVVRVPADQSEADRIASNAFIIRNIFFTGTGTAINLACTFGSRVEYCRAQGFKDPFVFRFCMNLVVSYCRATLFGNNGLTVDGGNWPGATSSNSGCNQSVIDHFRAYHKAGCNAGIYVGRSQEVEILSPNNEGGTEVNGVKRVGGKYGIFYDSGFGGVNKNITIRNSYTELRQTTAIYLRQSGGVQVIDGVHTVYPTRLMEFDNQQVAANLATRVSIANIGYVFGSTFKGDAASVYSIYPFPGSASLTWEGTKPPNVTLK